MNDAPLLMFPFESSASEGDEPKLTLVAGTAESRDSDAVDYLRLSGLPLSSVVLALFDQSDDCIKVIDEDGRLKFMNCNGRQAMEVDDFGSIAGCGWAEMWPADAQASVSKAITQAKLGRTTRFEAYCPTAKGTPRWWDVTVSPILAVNGDVEAILSSSRDITQRKINEQSLATMLDEMKHRLRNAYAIGSSIAMISAREQPEHSKAVDQHFSNTDRDDRYQRCSNYRYRDADRSGLRRPWYSDHQSFARRAPAGERSARTWVGGGGIMHQQSEAWLAGWKGHPHNIGRAGWPDPAHRLDRAPRHGETPQNHGIVRFGNGHHVYHAKSNRRHSRK